MKVKSGRFEGTATTLLAHLEVGQDTRVKGWPSNAKVLSNMLSRIAPNLRATGFTIEQATSGSGNDKRKIWRLSYPAFQATKKSTAIKCDPSDPSDPTNPRVTSEFATKLLAALKKGAAVARVATSSPKAKPN